METSIEVKKLCKSYSGVKAVQEVTISISRGEVFGLLGANGAGKSTTLECILGTKRPDSGTVSILGIDPQKGRKKLYERVGVQFQEANYQEKIRVAELCEVTAALYKKPMDYKRLLEQFGLSDKLKSQISELSGGQKQRLFIVLALIPNPEVVFLDELTTGLDTRARREVWKNLTDLKQKGMTILLTSHFMDEVEVLCDKIMILKKGKTIFYGTVQEAVAASPYQTFEDAYLWYTDEEGDAAEIGYAAENEDTDVKGYTTENENTAEIGYAPENTKTVKIRYTAEMGKSIDTEAKTAKGYAIEYSKEEKVYESI